MSVYIKYSTIIVVTDHILEVLHSYFGEPFSKATEMIDKVQITRYSTEDARRWVFEVSTPQEQYVVFEGINFCQCDFFHNCVLGKGTNITCWHVLTVNLAKVLGRFKQDKLSESVFAEYLNVKLLSVFDD